MNKNYTFRFHRNSSKGVNSLVQIADSLDDAIVKFNNKPSNNNTAVFEIKHQNKTVWSK
jgi:hypothetical protein